MAETIGSLVDKLTIVELRRFHTEQAMLNPAASVDLRHTAALRLRVVDEQRADLRGELDALWADICAGAALPKVYRQLKLYNDPALRGASDGRANARAGAQADDLSRTADRSSSRSTR